MVSQPITRDVIKDTVGCFQETDYSRLACNAIDQCCLESTAAFEGIVEDVRQLLSTVLHREYPS